MGRPFITFVVWVSFVGLAPSTFNGARAWTHPTCRSVVAFQDSNPPLVVEAPHVQYNRRWFVMSMGRFNKLQTYIMSIYKCCCLKHTITIVVFYLTISAFSSNPLSRHRKYPDYENVFRHNIKMTIQKRKREKREGKERDTRRRKAQRLGLFR